MDPMPNGNNQNLTPLAPAAPAIPVPPEAPVSPAPQPEQALVKLQGDTSPTPAAVTQVQAAPQVPQQPQKQPEVKLPDLPVMKPVGPSFFGYKVPKWANDFDYVRANKGKGSEDDSDTWLLFTVDRLLKKHSV